MNALNADASIPQILFNKFFILFPPDSWLSWLIFGVFFLILLYLYLLPKRIHDEAIVKLENKLAIDLTEIKGRLNKETELLKIIRSQVEPQKIDAYLAIAESCGESYAVHLADQQNLPPVERKRQIENNKATFLLDSRLFLFASDETINKYISIGDDDLVPLDLTPSFNQYAAFMVSMRQDLHNDTQIDSTHFCTIFGKIKLS